MYLAVDNGASQSAAEPGLAATSTTAPALGSVTTIATSTTPAAPFGSAASATPAGEGRASAAREVCAPIATTADGPAEAGQTVFAAG